MVLKILIIHLLRGMIKLTLTGLIYLVDAGVFRER